ncbi:DUF2752 domain-containing protein [Rapidithrix thailandica]|uniref:DUF2752 domain-containing protein n=1 Tax=Rapidithrix thailandica TaxID=413964 RepID=UPI003D284B53
MGFIKNFVYHHLELLFWSGGLIVLFILPIGESHFSICPFYHLGFDFCPGCGLGRSLHYLLHFDLKTSFEHHPLGIFAVIIIIQRIITLLKNNFKYKPYEP